MKCRLIAVTLILVLVLLTVPVAAQYKPEFKLSLVISRETPWGQAAIRFSDVLRQRTQGRVNITSYFDGQLFKGRQTSELSCCNRGSPTSPWDRPSTGLLRSRS